MCNGKQEIVLHILRSSKLTFSFSFIKVSENLSETMSGNSLLPSVPIYLPL